MRVSAAVAMTMTMTMTMAGCGAPPPAAPNCASKPADFRSFADPLWFGPNIPIEMPTPTEIELTAAGRPAWNGAVLGGADAESAWVALDRYLGVFAGLQPQPFVTLVFRRGTACVAVERARILIRRRFECGPQGRCFQGPSPR